MASSYVAILLTLLSLGASGQDLSVTKGNVSSPRVRTSQPNDDSMECYACKMVASQIGSSGCAAAVIGSGASCGPAALICSAIVGKACVALADYMNGGSTAEEACGYLGYCGNDCDCGVCTPDVADASTGRPLGLPFKRANGKSLPGTPKLPTTVTESSGNNKTRANMTSGSDLGAKCDGSKESYGFCLTCSTANTIVV